MIAIAKPIKSEYQIPNNWIEELQPELIRFALRRTKDLQLAEDAVQDALLAAVRSISQFRGDGCFEGWVFAILRRKIVDMQRKETRNVRLLNDYDIEHHVSKKMSCDLSKHLQLQETQEAILMEIENLPSRLASVIKLACLEGHSCQVIAERLGISLGNVWVSIHRARKELKKRLAHA